MTHEGNGNPQVLDRPSTETSPDARTIALRAMGHAAESIAELNQTVADAHIGAKIRQLRTLIERELQPRAAETVREADVIDGRAVMTVTISRSTVSVNPAPLEASPADGNGRNRSPEKIQSRYEFVRSLIKRHRDLIDMVAQEVHQATGGQKPIADLQAIGDGMLEFACAEFEHRGVGEDFETFARAQLTLCLNAYASAPEADVLPMAPFKIVRISGMGHRVNKNSPVFMKNVGSNPEREERFAQWSQSIDGLTGETHAERVLAATIYFAPWACRQVLAVDASGDYHIRIADMTSLMARLNNLLWKYDPKAHGEDFAAHAGPLLVDHMQTRGQERHWSPRPKRDERLDVPVAPSVALKEEISPGRDPNSRPDRFAEWAASRHLRGETVFEMQGDLIRTNLTWMISLRDAIVADMDSTEIDLDMLQTAGYRMLKMLVSTYDPGAGDHGEDFRAWAEQYVCAGILRSIKARTEDAIPHEVHGVAATVFLQALLNGDSSPQGFSVLQTLPENGIHGDSTAEQDSAATSDTLIGERGHAAAEIGEQSPASGAETASAATNEQPDLVAADSMAVSPVAEEARVTETPKPPPAPTSDPDPLLMAKLERDERIITCVRQLSGASEVWDVDAAREILRRAYASTAKSALHGFLKREYQIAPKNAPTEKAADELLHIAVETFAPVDSDGERFRGHLQQVVKEHGRKHYDNHN